MVDFKKKVPRPLQHLPLIQTIIYLGFFFEFQFLHQEIYEITKKFQKVSREINEEFQREGQKFSKETKIQKLKEIRYYAKKAHDAKTYQNQVKADFYDLKIYETYLEGAPQSVLQLYIILHTCSIEPFQWGTLITSFMAFSYASAEIYLTYPTKVLR